MSVWGGAARWGSSVWDDGTAKFSRDFSVAPPAVTVSFPVRVSIRLAAKALALAGAISTLTRIAFQAARRNSTVQFASGRLVALSAVMASFSATVGRVIRLTLAAATSGAIVTGYGSGGYGLGGYGSSATAPQILVSRGIQASMTALSGSLSKTLLVALKLFSAVTNSLAAALHERVAIGFRAGMANFKGFAYGLIRKIRVRGGR